MICGPGTSQALTWTQASRNSSESGALNFRPCLQPHASNPSLVHTGMVNFPALILPYQFYQGRN
jgi:hypothetical protein